MQRKHGEENEKLGEWRYKENA